jgi:hypothetical protein
MTAEYSHFVKNDDVLKDTIMIDRNKVGMLDFDLSNDQKIQLMKSGCEAVLQSKNREDLIPKCQFSIEKNNKLQAFVNDAMSESVNEAESTTSVDNISNSNSDTSKKNII